jgi:hypothetical protein
MERVTFSPGEFAALFGKSQTWGYRQIYAGKVQAISEFGRILIPAAEVEKILKTASRYEGKKTPPKTKVEFAKLVPTLPTAWQDYLRSRRCSEPALPDQTKASGKKISAAERRRQLLARVASR